MKCKQKRLACKLSKQSDIAHVLPFAEYFVSPLWPYRHVIKNSPGFHGEGYLLLVYLGKTLTKGNKTTKSLGEQYVYSKNVFNTEQ